MSRRVRIGRVPIDRVTFGEALAAVERLVDAKRGGTVFTPNVDHVVLAEHDEALRAAYAEASLSIADGMPVVWASRLLGDPLPEKVSGSDLALPLVDLASRRRFRVYLLGGAAGSAERAARVVEARGARVVGFASPSIEADPSDASCASAADAIARASPELVLVGLGAPKQEKLAHAIAPRVRPAVLLGVGATIDFLAGATPRAPALVSRVGLEWLYRLAHEPRRLWRRYLLRDPEFARVVYAQLRAARVTRRRDEAYGCSAGSVASRRGSTRRT